MNQGVILETIKSSFLFNFRTGIVIVDTLITGLVIVVTTHLLNLVTSNSSRLVQIWQQWLRRGSSRAKITITGKNIQGRDSTNLLYSVNFMAVLARIKNLNCDMADITELSEVPVDAVRPMHWRDWRERSSRKEKDWYGVKNV